MAPHGPIAQGLRAGLAGAILGGLPSALLAVAAGADPLEPTLAAGSILLPGEQRRRRLLAASVPVHVVVSLGWGVTLSALLPRRHTVAAGAAAGLAIAAIDLGAFARFFPRVRVLPLLPQLADHAAYGAIVGGVLARHRAACLLR